MKYSQTIDVLNMQNKKIHEKFRMIREAEGLGRGEFSEITGIPKRTIENIENKGTNPRASYINEICSVFPEYALWLMLNEINIEIGQVSPKIKTIWNKYTIDQYEMDELEAYGIDINLLKEEGVETRMADGVITGLKFDRFNIIHRGILINIIDECSDDINDAIDTTENFK